MAPTKPRPKIARKKATKPRTNTVGFQGISEDDLLHRIQDGETLTAIAVSVGRSKSLLLAWLNATPDRSARAKEARILAASSWDDLAEAEIRAAADGFRLAKAKEIAHHYRWRASKIAPAIYGDTSKVQLSGTLTIEAMTAEQIAAEIATLSGASRADPD